MDKDKFLGELAYIHAQKMHNTRNDQTPYTRADAIEDMRAGCPVPATEAECDKMLSKALYAAVF